MIFFTAKWLCVGVEGSYVNTSKYKTKQLKCRNQKKACSKGCHTHIFMAYSNLSLCFLFFAFSMRVFHFYHSSCCFTYIVTIALSQVNIIKYVIFLKLRNQPRQPRDSVVRQSSRVIVRLAVPSSTYVVYILYLYVCKSLK